MAFVHLSARSHYSFLDSALSPDDIARRASELKMPAITMMDSSNLCGIVEFQKACDKHEVRPIFGASLWTIPEDHTSTGKKPPPGPGYMLGFLVENATGYRNLCHLITVAHTQRDYAPRIKVSQILEHQEGLIVFTKGRYGLFGLLTEPKARAELERLAKGVDPKSLFVELIDWGLEGDNARNDLARNLAVELSIQTVVTSDARYIGPEDAPLIGTMHSIALGIGAYAQDHPDPHDTDQAWLRSEDEIRDLWPDDLEAIERTEAIADRCQHRLELGKVCLPESEPPSDITRPEDRWAWLLKSFPPPKDFDQIDIRPEDIEPDWPLADRYLAWYARTGLALRLKLGPEALQFGTPEEYSERLEMELTVMRNMGFAAYHLIVAEFINWSKDNGIAVGPGRGSAAGSLVTWGMRITDINPIQFGLMFERYLNPMRISMPDIDVDFAQQGREGVIVHVRETYGDAQVGQILTIGTMKAKAALKDCAKAYGVRFLESDRWSKAIPDGPVKLKDAILQDPWLRAMAKGDPLFRSVSTTALKLEGRPRQTGVHAAGVIITSRPIESFTPLHHEPGKDGSAGKSLTGVEMNAAEGLGLVKFDFLGLKTLDIIEMACDSVEARTGKRPQPIQPLFDDPAVFELLTKGDSLGLFQVESHGMQDLLRRMKPDRFEDLIALVALYRPGPLGSGMVDQYVECKHGRADVVYPHALLEEVLAPTYGVIVYQEQVMQAAQVLAGFDLGQADLLRRAMGKKKQAEMDKQRKKFAAGCETNGIEEKDAIRIFNLIDHFAGYGFNKCLSGSTKVLRAGANKHGGPWITIKELFDAQNSRTHWGKKIRSGKLNLIQMHDDGRMRPGHLKQVIHNGVRQLFDVTTESGLSISGTNNHRLLTDKGYKRIDELKMGDLLVCIGERETYKKKGHQTERAIGKTYVGINHGVGGEGQLPGGNQNPAWIDGRYAALKQAKETLCARANDTCEKCGIHHAPPYPHHTFEAAHQKQLDECNGDFLLYNSAENLKLLCNSCHKKLDYAKGERKKRWTKGRPAILEPIKSISIGEIEEVFDLEMKAPNHNFIANGIVSHNSHSAAYAVITYETAYMKAHHRADLMAAAMTFEQSDRDKLIAYVSDCMQADIKILPPHINHSKAPFTVEVQADETLAIRYGLGAIKGLGGAALHTILEHQPFASFEALQDQPGVNKSVLQALIGSGATDGLDIDRFEAWWKLNKPKPARKPRGFNPDQLGLFGGRTMKEEQDEVDAKKEEEAKPRRWSFTERLDREHGTLGCWLSGHPLDRFVSMERRIRTCTTGELATKTKKDPLTFVGVITKVHTIKTRRGDQMGYFTISDRVGLTEVVLQPRVWKKYKPLISRDRCVVVRGRLDRDGDQGKVVVDVVSGVRDLAQQRSDATKGLHLCLFPSDTDESHLQEIRECLASYIVSDAPTGPRLRIHYLSEDQTYAVMFLEKDPVFDPRPKLFQDIENITGRPDALSLKSPMWSQSQSPSLSEWPST